MIPEILLWVSIVPVAYVYFGYPLLLWVISSVFPPDRPTSGITPSVSLLVAAHNEAKVIAEKIRNALALEYPANLLSVVIACDGSSDATAEIVRSVAQKEAAGRVQLFDFSQNRGKVGALNEAIQHLSSEIVAFSDASSMLAPDSVRRLAHHFSDPQVGAVSGVYRLLKKDEAALGAQEDFYWKYETFLKVREARLGAFTGAHGSLYAIRRALYPFPSVDSINDDFIIPMRIQQKGYRIAYEPAAVAYEEAHEMEGFSRRIRITAGNLAQLRELKGLFWPPRPLALFCLISHKLGRLLVPLALLTLLACNVILWNSPFYRWLLLGQLTFYFLAALGAFVRLRPRVLRLPYYFCMINSALFAWMYHARRLGRLIPTRVQLDDIGGQPEH
jgi:cellulose synthase/poly-beta-1,6-N-acetylglucosamine synthase-like glycosyltransferase